MVFISFILSVHSENNLKQSLESIFSQTFDDFELYCIVNNNSENISKILEAYDTDKRFKLVTVSDDANLSSIKNNCIKKSFGRYISFLTNENTLMIPDILEEINEIINKNPSNIFTFNTKRENEKNLHNNPFLNKSLPHHEHLSLLKTEEYDTPAYLSGNIFDKKYLIENGIKFRNLPHQNTIFLVEAITRNDHYLTIPKFYTKVNTDIPENISVRTYASYLQAYNIIADILSSNKKYEKLLEKISKDILKIRETTLPEFSYEEFRYFEKDIKNLMTFMTNNKYSFSYKVKRTFRYIHNRIYNRVNDFDVLISIIIPTYNVEKYLGECLLSLLNQSFENFEIIIVDDSSTDSTVDVIKFYENLDPRIRFYEKDYKSGSGGSRNYAMNFARGKYVQFLDADDWLDLCTLEKVVSYAEKYELDMLMFKLIPYDNVDQTFFKQDYYSITSLDNFNYKVFNLDDVPDKLFRISVTPVNKLYSRIFLTSIGATYPEDYIHQDNPYFYQVFCEAERVYLIDEYFYNRRLRNDSTSFLRDDTQLGTIEIVEYILKVFIDNTLYEEFKRGVLNLIVFKLRNRSKDVGEEYFEEYYIRAKRKLYKFINEYGLDRDFRENIDRANLEYYENVLSSKNYEDFLKRMNK